MVNHRQGDTLHPEVDILDFEVNILAKGGKLALLVGDILAQVLVLGRETGPSGPGGAPAKPGLESGGKAPGGEENPEGG